MKIEAPKAAPVDAAADQPEAGDKKKGGKKKGGKKKKEVAVGAKILQAREVGRLVAEAAKEKGITKIRFDRGGYLYHGRIAALADAMRKGGLEF